MLKIFDATSKKGISWYFRQKRMKYFINYVNTIDKVSVNILDLGGTPFFWERLGFANSKKVRITILNHFAEDCPYSNISCIVGSATDISTYPKEPFDIIFSNSTIEHLFTYENQKQMASNILGYGNKFFIQTPNYYFPLEPHFIFPFFHYLPIKFKIYLITHFSLGSYAKAKNYKSALKLIEEIKLLEPRQMRELFPGLQILFEKFLFLNKSIIAQNLY
jgi:hypothetical protein